MDQHMDETPCARCGKSFRPRKRGHVFCSPNCRHLGVRLDRAPVDQDAVVRLFDESRTPEDVVRVGDWHPTPSWAELDGADTVERRRRWYMALAESGRL